jgi:hypothetical protein
MNEAMTDKISWILLALKVSVFLLLSLSSVDVVVVAYQQF